MMASILVYGAGWCPDCVRSRRFLDARKIPYMYIDIERTPEAAEEVVRLNERIGRGPIRKIPAIVIDGRTVLSEPSDSELASALGIEE